MAYHRPVGSPGSDAFIELMRNHERERARGLPESGDHGLIRELILGDRVWAGVERLENLARLARECSVPGAFVECGVAMGGCLAIMAAAAPDRTIWGFDSFAAMPELSAADEGDGEAFVGVCCAGPEGAASVTETFGLAGLPMDRIRIVEGWFEDTLVDAVPAIGDIAILRIDCDWHSATRLVLETLYDSVVSGGVVVIDDYGSFLGCRRAVDEFRSERTCGPLHHSDGAEAYWFV